jgi:signal transduction histidine kinase/CheY-like chemotaxis protein
MELRDQTPATLDTNGGPGSDRIPDTNPAQCLLPARPCLAGPLLEALPVPAFITTTTHQMVACNTLFCRYIGRQPLAVLGTSVSAILRPTNHGHLIETDCELLKPGCVQIRDIEVDHEDGTTRHVVLHRSLFRNDRDVPVAIVGLLQEVSKEHEALELQRAMVTISDADHHAEDLAELILRVHAALNSVFRVPNLGLALRDPASGQARFVYWADERDGEPADDAALVDLATRVIAESRDLRAVTTPASPQPGVTEVEATGSVATVGVPLLVDNTTTGALLVRTYSSEPGLDEPEVAILRRAAAQIAASIERFRSRATLRESEERYRTLFETVQSGLVVCEIRYDADGAACGFELATTNAAFDQLVGDRVSAWVGKQLIESALKNEPEIRALFFAVAGDRQPRTVERFARTLGKHLRLNVFSPKAGQVAALADDVSDRARAEEELARKNDGLRRAQCLQTIGQLAAGLAHQVNSALQSMMANLAALRVMCTGANGASERIAAIEREVEHQAATIRQLLLVGHRDIAKTEAIELSTMIRPALAQLDGADLARVYTVLELEHEPLVVRIDRAQLLQMIKNLTVNALEAMPRGGRLYIRTGRHDNGTAVIEIGDTGSGIAPDALDRLFEPFYTTKGDHPARGLGLAVVKAIVSNRGGTLEVESELEKGSVFRVLLPLDREVPDAPDRSESASSFDAPRSQKPRVLLVEDNDGAREGLQAVLDAIGYEATTASSGENALAFAQQKSFDLLLTDLVLPGISGTELASQFQRQQPNAAIVLMSGHTENATAKAAISIDSVRFLQKPFGIEALEQELLAALHEAEARTLPEPTRWNAGEPVTVLTPARTRRVNRARDVLESVADLAPAPALIVGPDMRIVKANQRIRDWLRAEGRLRIDPAGMPVKNALPWLPESAVSQIRMVLATGTPSTRVHLYLSAGRWAPVEIEAGAITADRNDRAVLVVLREPAGAGGASIATAHNQEERHA